MQSSKWLSLFLSLLSRRFAAFTDLLDTGNCIVLQKLHYAEKLLGMFTACYLTVCYFTTVYILYDSIVIIALFIDASSSASPIFRPTVELL